MLINSPDSSTCLLSWYGMLSMIGCVGGDFSQTRGQVGSEAVLSAIYSYFSNILKH